MVKNGAELHYHSYDTDEPHSLILAIENGSSEKIIKFLLDNGAEYEEILNNPSIDDKIKSDILEFTYSIK